MKILFIAAVWPEPTSSAAGIRFRQLIDTCHEAGFTLTVSSPCQTNSFQEQLDNQGIQTIRFEPNDSAFDTFIRELMPAIVIFDRFMIEEQFSWRVKACYPEAVLILDSCDLHSLRRLREAKIKAQEPILPATDINLTDTDVLRELAAIYRCDHTLVVSDYERDLLMTGYGIDASLLSLLRFWYEEIPVQPSYEDRHSFVSIGNFYHAPNLDSVRLLKKSLWPALYKAALKAGIDDPQLHIYGAYPTAEVRSFHAPKDGFHVLGWTPHAIDTLKNYRVNLAPLRFGAGIKGKISDGWVAGTPCVTTQIGAEGMHETLPWGGSVSDSIDQMIEDAITLYKDKVLWEQAQARGNALIQNLFQAATLKNKFLQILSSCFQQKQQGQNRHPVSALLWHQQFRATEYFSRWIELKQLHTKQ
jgi:glycosyltransferase involved in cell wall biosynthesis